jgi:hypothetical protein
MTLDPLWSHADDAPANLGASVPSKQQAPQLVLVSLSMRQLGRRSAVHRQCFGERLDVARCFADMKTVVDVVRIHE